MESSSSPPYLEDVRNSVNHRSSNLSRLQRSEYPRGVFPLPAMVRAPPLGKVQEVRETPFVGQGERLPAVRGQRGCAVGSAHRHTTRRLLSKEMAHAVGHSHRPALQSRTPYDTLQAASTVSYKELAPKKEKGDPALATSSAVAMATMRDVLKRTKKKKKKRKKKKTMDRVERSLAKMHEAVQISLDRTHVATTAAEVSQLQSLRHDVHRSALHRLVRITSQTPYGPSLRSIAEEYERRVGFLEGQLSDKQFSQTTTIPVDRVDASCETLEENEGSVVCFGDILRANATEACVGKVDSSGGGDDEDSEARETREELLEERVAELETLASAFLGGLQQKDGEIETLRASLAEQGGSQPDVLSDVAVSRKEAESLKEKWLSSNQRVTQLESDLSAATAELDSCHKELFRRDSLPSLEGKRNV